MTCYAVAPLRKGQEILIKYDAHNFIKLKMLERKKTELAQRHERNKEEIQQSIKELRAKLQEKRIKKLAVPQVAGACLRHPSNQARHDHLFSASCDMMIKSTK